MSRLIEKLFGTMPTPPNTLKLQRGDIVRLKSGGPQMTVFDVSSRGFIICEWFEGEKVNRARFYPAA